MNTIITPQPPKVKETGEHASEITIQPCFPGYGVTLGNALRRVLFSSLEGYAVTSVKIKDVEHEFSNIEGVLEDVVEIILNLKKLRFKMHSEDAQTLILKKNKEGKITAAEFEKSDTLEVLNTDAYIATLTKDIDFEMEIEVEKGLGYVATEQRENALKNEIGKIYIDAIFTPVIQVSHEVSDIRVGKKTDYNKVVFQIETDGSITPEEAFKQAAAILVDQYRAIAVLEEIEEEPVVEEVEEEIVEEEPKVTLDPKKPVDQIGLSTRTSNALIENDVKTVEKVAKLTEEEVSDLDGLGQKGINEIKETLLNAGLSLKA